MRLDEMLSLFAGFVFAAFLIWITNVCVGHKHQKVHKQSKGEHYNQKKDPRQTPALWNVSAFFRLHAVR